MKAALCFNLLALRFHVRYFAYSEHSSPLRSEGDQFDSNDSVTLPSSLSSLAVISLFSENSRNEGG